MGDENLLTRMSESMVIMLTQTIDFYSGILQLSIYLFIFITFGFALVKIHRLLQVLVSCDFTKMKTRTGLYDLNPGPQTPLSVIAAGFYAKAKKHYLNEQRNPHSNKIVPPDAFIADAAFQFSERYFESKFLEPMSMLASLMPPLGFIGTIIGMVIHFLSSSGDLKSGITIIGIATALYTTFIGLVFYTFLEFLKRYFYSLAQRRIDEGLRAVVHIDAASTQPENNET